MCTDATTSADQTSRIGIVLARAHYDEADCKLHGFLEEGTVRRSPDFWGASERWFARERSASATFSVLGGMVPALGNTK